MRVDWVGVRVRWWMYGVRVCVAAKVRMIPLPILYCHRGVRVCVAAKVRMIPLPILSCLRGRG